MPRRGLGARPGLTSGVRPTPSQPAPRTPADPPPRESNEAADEPAPPPPNPDAWTVRKLMGWITSALERNRIDSPRLCAELLLAHVLSCERLRLYMDADREVEPSTLATLRGLVARALKHEPIQYLTGESVFFGMPFIVDRRVLIPRPSSETLVEEALQHVRRLAPTPPPPPPTPTASPTTPTAADEPAADPPAPPPPKAPMGQGLLIADVCTGSGCIAIALAKRLSGARVIASDISPDALECAALNAERHMVRDRVELREGDLLGPLAPEAGRIEILTANPPYIPDHEWEAVEPNVKHFEPEGALRGGPDGLGLVGPVIDGALGVLRPGGLLLVEIAACTAGGCVDRALAAGLVAVRVLRDIDGLDRVLSARAPA